ncbi:DNA replication complex GINS protein psf2 [Talaromyces pinophilus]|nr:DNA replication complex GINS protein psf2 [Talaromyces pinophilus]
MAFPLQRGLTPPEIEFLSEMEMVTVVPRQRLEELELLSNRTPQSASSSSPRPEKLKIYIPRSRIDRQCYVSEY